MRGRLAFLAALVVSTLVPTTASAGRSFYGWLYGTDTMPERGAEIATWISETNDVAEANHQRETRWWVAPLIGITDELELALPVEIAWDRSDVANGHTAFDRWGGELRYRLVTSDPVDAPALVPLVRVAVYRMVLERDTLNPEVDAVVSYRSGILHASADLGGYAEINKDNQHFELHPGAGVSIEAVGDLRFGAELHAELSLDHSIPDAASWVAIGPNFAWSHGRTWISGAYGIGVYRIHAAPRLQWGVAF